MGDMATRSRSFPAACGMGIIFQPLLRHVNVQDMCPVVIAVAQQTSF